MKPNETQHIVVLGQLAAPNTDISEQWTLRVAA